MDILLDMAQLETVALLHIAIMVMAMEELELFMVKDKKTSIQDRIFHVCE